MSVEFPTAQKNLPGVNGNNYWLFALYVISYKFWSFKCGEKQAAPLLQDKLFMAIPRNFSTMRWLIAPDNDVIGATDAFQIYRYNQIFVCTFIDS